MNPTEEQKATLLASFRAIVDDFHPIAIGEQTRSCDVLFAYRLLLGRMPHSQEEIAYVMSSSTTFREFLNRFLETPEFSKRFCFLPGGHLLMTEANGFRLWFDSSDREMGGAMAAGSYEGETASLIRRFLKPGMTCLDIGAQIGFFTCLMGQIVGPTGKIFAFEPLPASFTLLRKNIFENRFDDRILLHQVACANERRQLLVDLKARMVVASRAGSTAIDAIAVDDIVKEHVDFCKVDVEGHEPSVIEGMVGVLRKSRPVLLTEFNQYWLKEAGSSVADYAGLLRSLGYDLWNTDPALSPFDENLQFEPLANFNVVATAHDAPSARDVLMRPKDP